METFWGGEVGVKQRGQHPKFFHVKALSHLNPSRFFFLSLKFVFTVMFWDWKSRRAKIKAADRFLCLYFIYHEKRVKVYLNKNKSIETFSFIQLVYHTKRTFLFVLFVFFFSCCPV